MHKKRGIMKAMRGLTVVSLEQAVAAPLATCRMADAGARVIKVEREGGDFARKYDNMVHGDSTYFTWLNRGKESLVLDIKAAEDRELLQKVIAEADVFVQNLAPGAAERAGFGSAALRELNPSLVTLDITGYGESGPKATLKAYDLLVQCESAICEVTGTPDGPGRVGISICDITAGMNGYAGVLSALLERSRTGKGQGLSVSLFSSASELMAVPYLQQKYTGTAPKRVGIAHPAIAPYGAFDTKDDKKIVISIQSDREWGWLVSRVLGRPELAEDERYHTNVGRVANRGELDSMVGAHFVEYTRDELMTVLQEASIACAALNDAGDLVEHPQLQTVHYDNSTGVQVEVVSPAVSFGSELAVFGDIPKIGQHTEKIRAEFG